MHRLVSPFILDQYNAGADRGDLTAASLFVDIAGFSTLTRTLMDHGQHGSEVLATIMRAFYSPLVAAVYGQGGFITVFAGDAFTALLPVVETELEIDLSAAARRALAAGWVIREAVIDQTVYETEYGGFDVGVKVRLAVGDCHWEIIRASDSERATFYFRGTAVVAAAAAEKDAGQNMLVLAPEAQSLLGDAAVTVPAGDHARVLTVADDLPEPGEIVLAEAGATPFFPEAALAWVEPMVAYLTKGGDLAGMEWGFRNHFVCYRVLRANLDPRAPVFLQAANEALQNRAARLESDDDRTTFLKAIPWHRAIVAACEGWDAETGTAAQAVAAEVPLPGQPLAVPSTAAAAPVEEPLAGPADNAGPAPAGATPLPVSVNNQRPKGNLAKKKRKKKKKKRKTARRQPAPPVVNYHFHFHFDRDQTIKIDGRSLEAVQQLLSQLNAGADADGDVNISDQEV